MIIKKLIRKIAGKPKQPTTQKVKVDINYVQSYVEPGSFFGLMVDITETEIKPIKPSINN